MIRTWMVHLGLGCVIAENGEDAQTLIGDNCPDVLITDVEMPIVNGIELACWIRENADLRIASLPIIMVTSLEDPELEEIISEIGTPYLLRKPLSEESLRQTVHWALTEKTVHPKAPSIHKGISNSFLPWSHTRQNSRDAMHIDYRKGAS